MVNWQTPPGKYRVSVTERNITGCLGPTQEAYVWVRGTNFKARFPDKGCLFDSVTIEASGGRWYKWSNGLLDSTITLKLVGDTTLNVIISDTICGIKSDTFPVSIKAISKPDVAIISDAEQVYRNQSFNLVYNGSKNDNVNWQIGLNTPITKNAHRINVRFNDTGDVLVKVFATNALGCSDSAYKRIEVIGDRLFFPTAFSPNRDGLNDIFLPSGMDVSKYKLTLFNGWGQVIFVSNNPTSGWDGTFEGAAAPTGTYIYQCDVVSNSGKKYAYNGTVTLIR
jgi:gliding motility-associated-like protein